MATVASISFQHWIVVVARRRQVCRARYCQIEWWQYHSWREIFLRSKSIFSFNKLTASMQAKRPAIGKYVGTIIWWEGGLQGVREESPRSMEEQPVDLIFPTDSHIHSILEISHVEKKPINCDVRGDLKLFKQASGDSNHLPPANKLGIVWDCYPPERNHWWAI